MTKRKGLWLVGNWWPDRKGWRTIQYIEPTDDRCFSGDEFEEAQVSKRDLGVRSAQAHPQRQTARALARAVLCLQQSIYCERV
jgi:hypothetical protein